MSGEDSESSVMTAVARITNSGQFVRDGLRAILDAYKHMEMSTQRFLLGYLLPAFLVTVGVSAAGVRFSPELWLTGVIIIFSFIPTFAVLTYPKIKQDRRVKEINAKFNLFITHLTVLSLTNTDRVEMFRRIADTDDYGALATEIGRLVGLIDTFNMSLEDAARRRAQETPSELLGNFYEQLAYNVGSGQTLPVFLVDEQESVQATYETTYKSQLERIDTLGELFLSMMLTTTFLFVFSVIIPFLTGMEPMLILSGVLFVYVIVQLLFFVLINATTPSDKFWFFPSGGDGSKQRVMQGALGVGLIGVATCIAVLGTLQPDIPTHTYPMICVTPLMLPAYYIYKIEKNINRAEGQFAEFIRSLGSIEAVKQTSTRNVLKTLKNKDFGPLTPYIESMYRRLTLSIDTHRAWQLFSAELGSHLIKRFSDMYVLGRDMGGEPDTLGNVISENFRTMQQLRKERRTKAGKITGMLYGITGASAVTFFIIIEILRMLIDVSGQIDGAGGATGDLLNPAVYDIDVIIVMVYAAIIVNTLLVSILVRVIKRRYIGGAVIHFTILVWITFSVGYLIEQTIGNFIGV